MLYRWFHWQGIYSVTMEYHFDQKMNVVSTSSPPQVVVDLAGRGTVGGMGVDWLGGNLFWTLPLEGRIDYVSVDGLGHRVFKSGLAGLTRLAVNSENRCVGSRTVVLWEREGGGWACAHTGCAATPQDGVLGPAPGVL